MFAIIRRELSSYFTSPIGYIYLAVFYALAGFYFFGSTLITNTTDMSYVFSSLFTIVTFLIPILTMRLLSEDKKNKTDQALLTAPITLFSLIMGKFLAAVLIFVLSVAVTLVFGVVIASFASPDWAVIIGNLVGLILLGSSLIAIGMFISALTENQVVAAVGGFAVALGLLLFDSLSSLAPYPWMQSLIEKLSFYNRYSPFTLGILNFSSIIFFLSVIAVFIFLTVRVFEKRRWG